jgi:hypothetical protein
MARNKDDPAAAAPPAGKAARPTFQRVATALVDDPGIAMRRVFDEDKLHELMADMQARGVLQPVGLIRAGARFRLVWGHRRTVAARAHSGAFHGIGARSAQSILKTPGP